MEQQGARRRSTDFMRGRKLGERDHLMVINKPKIRPDWMNEAQYEAAPASITVREFKAAGKVMVTTLNCPKSYPKVALKLLYQSRWQVELDLRNIKDTLQMNILSCKTPEMVRKEIWVYLLAYNLIRMMMAQQRIGNRSGRIEPRAVKRRPKAYPLLTVPRNEAREKVMKYGRPSKLK